MFSRDISRRSGTLVSPSIFAGIGLFATAVMFNSAWAEGLPLPAAEQKPAAETEAQLLQALGTSQALSVEERVARADWISLLHIESIGFLAQPSLSTGPEMTAIQALNYRATILKSIKGAESGAIKFRVDFSDCRAPLKVDEDYLVFGYTNHHGKLQSFGCEDLLPKSLYQSELAKVEALSAASASLPRPKLEGGATATE